jgi:ABC-type nitrate/sulfonate/bicarbonate transport system substrate-binding protein
MPCAKIKRCSCAASALAQISEDSMMSARDLRLVAPVLALLGPWRSTRHRAAANQPRIAISYGEMTADFVALWIASDVGYVKKRGLDVVVRYLPAQEGIPALITG